MGNSIALPLPKFDTRDNKAQTLQAIPDSQNDKSPEPKLVGLGRYVLPPKEMGSNIDTDNNISVLNYNYNNLKLLLEAYTLFDNYENKNEIIIKDLDKKLKNQINNIKKIDESNYVKLSNIETHKRIIDNKKFANKIYLILSIIILISIIVCVVLNKNTYIIFYKKNIIKS
mgnify:CR=1 FL=1